MILLVIRFRFAILLAPCILGCAEATDPPAVLLCEVWAYDMPGTRDVRELEPEVNGRKAVTTLSVEERDRRFDDSQIRQIREQLEFLEENESTNEGFAVSGKGLEALQNAHAVLVNNANRQQSFRSDDEISIVFFSHLSRAYVHIERVSRTGNVIDVKYRFVNHLSQNMTNHFALIPMGMLPVGKYAVTFTQLPNGKQLVPQGNVERIVCQTFTFSVAE